MAAFYPGVSIGDGAKYHGRVTLGDFFANGWERFCACQTSLGESASIPVEPSNCYWEMGPVRKGSAGHVR